MHTFLDAKLMAKALRTALAERQIDVTHSTSLELVARQFEFADWNMLAARIEATKVDGLAVPAGWVMHQDAPYPLFRMGLDPQHRGTIKILSVASADVVGGHFATLMQSILADDYRGGKVRLGAELRGEDVDRGTLWLRIDPAGGGKPLGFDNMLQRPADGALGGTFDWTERSIVLDVPHEAASLHYGPMLKGVGRLWARNVRLEIAEPDAATTDRRLPRRPTNLDFDVGGEAV